MYSIDINEGVLTCIYITYTDSRWFNMECGSNQHGREEFRIEAQKAHSRLEIPDFLLNIPAQRCYRIPYSGSRLLRVELYMHAVRCVD